MKFRVLLAAPLIAGVALLSACGGSDDSGSADKSDAATQTYLKVVNSSGTSFANDDDAVDAGKKVCSDLKSGTSMLDVTKDLESKAGGQQQAMMVASAAIGAFCPDQLDKVGAPHN
ncbi:DUF732 domain-containing protein [Gordonia phthalatica]|uniref:DUF732 domain-containing protein n=1 Tax=Gordonia phthalatica TaxID=1136941 RepID=A0A0N9N0R5_9ACTN|nr:DUF732 domain-containing protein [Gordonia phthalatica]ALG83685.1 hypothetical protein ACH46_03160 [Gordonia phthalatica]